MSDLLQLEPHPDADQLAAFVENALPPHERDQTLAHLAACPHCRQIVFLAQPSEPELLPQPIPTRKPLFAGWNLAWISAGALAAAGAITVTLRTHPTPARTIQQTIDTASVEDLPSPAPTPASPTPLQLAPAKPAAKTPNPIDNGRQAATVGGQQVAQLLPYSPLLHPPAPGYAAPVLGNGGVPAGFSGATVGNRPAPVATGSPARIAGTGAPSHALNLNGNASGGAGIASGNGTGVTVGTEKTLTQPAADESATLSSANAVGMAPLPPAPPPPSPKAVAAAPPPPQQQFANQTVTVATTADVESNAASFTNLLPGVASAAQLLPSHLPVASVITNGSRTVALDTHGALFLSKDAGKHWSAVSAPWSGRALRVSLAGASPDTGTLGQVSLAERSRAIAPGRADLSGTVTDATGAIIARAAIRLQAIAGSPVQTTRASQSGQFTLVNLEPGAYTLEISAPGFRTSVQRLDLHPGDRIGIPTVLTLGSVATTVTVQDAAPALDTENASVAAMLKKSKPKPPAFELTTDTGATWTSTDGKTWKPK